MTFASAKKTVRHVAESRGKDFHWYTSALDNTYSVQIEFLYVSLRPWCSWQLRQLSPMLARCSVVPKRMLMLATTHSTSSMRTVRQPWWRPCLIYLRRSLLRRVSCSGLSRSTVRISLSPLALHDCLEASKSWTFTQRVFLQLRSQHFAVIATLVESEAPRMSHGDIALCLDAFRRVALRFDGAVVAGLTACAESLRRAWVLRQKAELRTAEVATLLDCASLFGISSCPARDRRDVEEQTSIPSHSEHGGF